MVHIRATLRMAGATFSPRAAVQLTGVPLSSSREPGELVHSGRYAGRPSPYGSAEIRAPGTAKFLDGQEDEFFARVSILARAAKTLGADDVVLHLDIEHDGQCNIEFKPAFVAAVQRLGVPLTMTCYQGDPVKTSSDP